MKQPTQERLMCIIEAPVVSEKSTYLGDKRGQYVFSVAPDATKPEVKAAIELLFKVKVKAVQVANVGGKDKRMGRFAGKKRDWRKAYVSLQAGQEIDFTGVA